jgi:phenylalanyl-tRNA synthetase alpha chain
MTDIKKIISKLHPLERAIIPHLKDNISLKELSRQSNQQEIETMRALQWLENKQALKIISTKKIEVDLDTNAIKYKKSGLPEKRFLKELNEEEFTSLSQIAKNANLENQEASACIGILKKIDAIETRKQTELEFKITNQGKKFLREKNNIEKFLENFFPHIISKEDEPIISILKKRKNFIKVEDRKEVKIHTLELTNKLQKEKIKTDITGKLTSSMLKTGEWKNLEFRGYDVEINVPKINPVRRHPYNESLNIIRQAFLEMGFSEMKGPWVETSFWGMDSMWIAQDHPMREAQDTFYLDTYGDLPNKELTNKVKAAHENGYNTGSTGHTKEWDPKEASKLILRQHSTSTTFRYFYEKKLNHDCKYFYIADNFRNEAIDATHLPEFGQAEGFIMADNLTLANLMGFVKEFYKKLGITKIKFKPTFNPYTEPSMEAHYYNEKLGKWYALINSGIFRPEALAPFGITKSVIAWGMGSSRIAALLSGKTKLKEIFGPEVDIDWIRNHKRIKIDVPQENKD